MHMYALGGLHSLEYAYIYIYIYTQYLTVRSMKTTAYYREKLGAEYPASRKHLIPYVF